MPEPARLLEVLERHQRLGFFGPGAIEDGLRHARGFVRALRPTTSVLDLGSGGGLPGLLVAVELPEARVVLLDASERRADALRRAVGSLGLGERVEVWHGRAEQLGREPSRRGSVGAVVSRGFGAPLVTAACAVPFLVVGGQLVVSEPPDGGERWPAAGLAQLGLVADVVIDPAYASFTQSTLRPSDVPRRSR